jgi:hypothetical protein
MSKRPPPITPVEDDRSPPNLRSTSEGDGSCPIEPQIRKCPHCTFSTVSKVQYFNQHVAQCLKKADMMRCECRGVYTRALFEGHMKECSNYQAAHLVVEGNQLKISGFFLPRGGQGEEGGASKSAAAAAAAPPPPPTPTSPLHLSPPLSPQPSPPPDVNAWCKGFMPRWKRPFCARYPFMLHSPQVPSTNPIGYSDVPWIATTAGVLVSHSCTGLDDSLEYPDMCESCANLQHLSVFKHMQDCHANEGMEALTGYNHPLLTFTQLRSHTRHHKETKDASARAARDAAIKVAKWTTTISQHKQLIVYIA